MCWFYWMLWSFVTTFQDDYKRYSHRMQPSATHPIFWTNLHFIHLLQNFNLNSWLTVLTNCLKWRFVRKRGWVADGCWERIFEGIFKDTELKSSTHPSKNAFPNVRSAILNLRLGSINLDESHVSFVIEMLCYLANKVMLPKRIGRSNSLCAMIPWKVLKMTDPNVFRSSKLFVWGAWTCYKKIASTMEQCMWWVGFLGYYLL